MTAKVIEAHKATKPKVPAVGIPKATARISKNTKEE